MLNEKLAALPLELSTVLVSWTKRDVLLFANSIGCLVTEPWFLYEGHSFFTAFPTFPILLSFKHTNDDVVDFNHHFNRFINVPIKGVPRLDSSRVVDGGRTISIFKELPVTSKGMVFKLRTTLLDVGDKGKIGTTIKLQHEILEDGSGELYARMTEVAFYLGQGGWGGPKGMKLDIPSAPSERTPSARIEHQISPTAHLLYRLNADYNPLHATPEPGRRAGLGGVIMHGLYTWNVTCRHLLETFAGSQASSLRSFEGQFVKPVRPGDTLHIDAWVMSPKKHDSKWHEVRYLTSVNQEGVCLKGSAVMKVLPPAINPKL